MGYRSSLASAGTWGLVITLTALGVLGALGHDARAMYPVPPAAISYADLTSIDARTRLCTRRPVQGAAIYAAMTGQSAANKLRDVELLQHAATRLGYGLSPFGPLVPGKNNDCTTVFIAEEIARQISVLGANSDHPLILQTRRGLLPLTRFLRNDINQAVVRFKPLDPSGESYGTLWWESWVQVAGP